MEEYGIDHEGPVLLDEDATVVVDDVQHLILLSVSQRSQLQEILFQLDNSCTDHESDSPEKLVEHYTTAVSFVYEHARSDSEDY